MPETLQLPGRSSPTPGPDSTSSSDGGGPRRRGHAGGARNRQRAAATPDERASAPPRRGFLRRAWPVARVVVGFALVAVALWVLSSKGSELSGFADVFKTLVWWWVPPAFAAEIASYFCFAAMQYELFKAGHLARRGRRSSSCRSRRRR